MLEYIYTQLVSKTPKNQAKNSITYDLKDTQRLSAHILERKENRSVVSLFDYYCIYISAAENKDDDVKCNSEQCSYLHSVISGVILRYCTKPLIVWIERINWHFCFQEHRMTTFT